MLDPLHEAAHRALMRLFAADGRRQQALGQYHLLREALRRELEAEPDPQTARLYRALLRGEVRPRPAEPAAPAGTRPPRTGAPAERARHNLPIALTSFIGRDRELREVARLLDRHRLVTLTGAGGSGKTRLGSRGRDGAASARAPTASGSWSWRAWATPRWCRRRPPPRSGSRFPSQRPALEGLSAQLGQWHTLLILDNCEHLIAACAVLAERLLRRLPGAAHPGHEPRAPARPGRGDLAGPVAGAAGPRAVA